MDLEKDLNLEILHQKVLDLYFPDGKSNAQNLDLSQVNHYLASFSGSALPSLQSEGGFTVGRYFEHVKTYPIRIYLHTTLKVTENIMVIIFIS